MTMQSAGGDIRTSWTETCENAEFQFSKNPPTLFPNPHRLEKLGRHKIGVRGFSSPGMLSRPLVLAAPFFSSEAVRSKGSFHRAANSCAVCFEKAMSSC